MVLVIIFWFQGEYFTIMSYDREVLTPISKYKKQGSLLSNFITYTCIFGKEALPPVYMLQCINVVGSNPVEGRTKIWQL
jgi:hypothetical protein